MDLADLRKEIRSVDEDIVWLIAERISLAEKIFAAKKEKGLKIEDAQQEKQVINNALDLATELFLDVGAIKEIVEILIKMSREKQHELLGEDNLP